MAPMKPQAIETMIISHWSPSDKPVPWTHPCLYCLWISIDEADTNSQPRAVLTPPWVTCPAPESPGTEP